MAGRILRPRVLCPHLALGFIREAEGLILTKCRAGTILDAAQSLPCQVSGGGIEKRLVSGAERIQEDPRRPGRPCAPTLTSTEPGEKHDQRSDRSHTE